MSRASMAATTGAAVLLLVAAWMVVDLTAAWKKPTTPMRTPLSAFVPVTPPSKPPTPPPSASAPVADAGRSPNVDLPSAQWPRGTWVSDAVGDAIPRGPFGGVIVQGGARIMFERGRPHSKTPWNLRAWLGRTRDGKPVVVTLGCGYYPSGTVFCRSDGMNKSVRNTIEFSSQAGAVHVFVPDLLDELIKPR